MHRSWKGPILVLVLLLATVLAIVGCGRQSSLVTAPVADEGAGGFVLKLSDVGVQAAIRVQNAHTARLMAMPGVVGTAITADPSGKPAIMVMTEYADARPAACRAGRLPGDRGGHRQDPRVEEHDHG